MSTQANSVRQRGGELVWFVSCLAGPALLLLALRHSLGELVGYWEKPEYGHGYFIPVIAIFMAWHRLAELRPVPQPAPSALALIVAAMAMSIIGDLSTFKYFAFYGVIVGAAGYFALYFGWHALRLIAPAMVYLLFAVPLPQTLFFSLSNEMQLISTNFGFEILDALGIPVYQEGNIVDLGGFRLQVVDACSGLRYLFPLMSFGYLTAYLLEDRLWKRILLFVSTVPITIGMNSFRIAFIGVTVDLWGPDMASGLLHDFEGWSIFLLCVLVLFAEMALLVRIGHRGTFRLSYLGLAGAPPFARIGTVSVWSVIGLALSAGFAILSSTDHIANRREFIPEHRPLIEFPHLVGDWHGRQSSLEPEILEGLALDDYWIGSFNPPGGGAPVEFYTAYYASQRIGSTAHSPSNCIPGSGWVVESNQTRSIDLGPGEAPLEVKRVIISRAGIQQLVYYWFDESGREMATEYQVKYSLFRNSLIDHRSDGALIRLVTPVSPRETIEDAEQRMRSFLTLVHPVILQYLPAAPVPGA